LALSDDLDFENLDDLHLDDSIDVDDASSSACASIYMDSSTATQSVKETMGSNEDAASTTVAAVVAVATTSKT
jgi:hypothetical protein